MRFQKNTIFLNPSIWLVSMDPLPDLYFQACRPTTKAMPNVALRKTMNNVWLNGSRSIAKQCWHIVSGNPVNNWQTCNATVPLDEPLQNVCSATAYDPAQQA